MIQLCYPFLPLLSLVALVVLYFKMKKQMKALEKMNQDLALIQALSIEISSELEQKKVTDNVMKAFAKAGNVSKGSLMLYNEETQLLEIVAGIGLSERAYKFVKPKLGEGIAGRVASTGKSILINDTEKDAQYKDFVTDETKERPKETMLCLPLTVKGMVTGVVTLDSKLSGEQFLRNDEMLMTILANQAAVAIYNARLYEMAITDGLTGLFIHKHFQERLKMETERVRRYGSFLSLMMMDVDKFKNFNDTYGHQAGDRVLVSVARMIKASMRNVDVCARYGGEEFAVYLPETKPDDAFLVAERLRKKIEEEKILYDGREFRLTISIGVATSPFNKNSLAAEDLIKNADRALYTAKETGRNRVEVYEKIQLPGAK